ncbi:vWA domain-containing protein [Salsipaludibacter albus]|uniref:vWA domain-containing protein n=1 Tax=Salsipaludibacter albus TaxID=2849650 RepID=UPI001EE3C2C8|nr:von Willebrand factor type A domain-containing protein [Salsipaludibacter albus]MBY5164168.1 von Willebrand factor type A domain-containing protein [Salsipaludibacter albus]
MRRPTTHHRPIRPLAGAVALVLVLSACSGGDDATESSGATDEVAVDVAPRDAEEPEAATEEMATEAAAGEETAAADPVEPGQVAVAPRGDDALSQPLPVDPAPDAPPVVVDEPDVAPPANPWEDPVVDPRSTFGLDVDTVSYGRIREAVASGRSIDPGEVRIEEVVNALDYDYDPDPAEVFGVTADGAAWAWGRESGTHLLRIGLTTPAPEVRDPVDLVFVIDASGSMASAMPDVQESLHVLVDALEPGADRIAIVTYDSVARSVLAPTDVEQADVVRAAIGEVRAGGSTNLADGLALGYDQAARMTEDQPAGTNTRVVLLSDGIANTGTTDVESILARVEGGVDAGIELLTVGFGMGGFNDPLMEQLADRGDGRAVYVDTPDEAHELFGEQLASTLQTVAVDARSQVAFNPDVVAAYRLLGYDNRAIADDDFRDDTVDAGEIGAGHAVTALYELDLHPASTRPAGSEEVATVSLRWLDPDTRRATEIARRVALADLASGWESAPAGLRLAGTAAAWAEVLRLSPHAPYGRGGELADEARRIADAVGTAEVAEWADLVASTTDA